MTHHTIMFDTFQYAKDLKKAGFNEIQVETHVKYAKEQAKNINDVIDDSLATKKDIKELEIKMELIRKDTIIKLASILGGITVFCFSAATTILGFLISRLH